MPEFDYDAVDPLEELVKFVNLATGREGEKSPSCTGDVFFYAAGGDDWRPLAEFKKCKVFVYCDAVNRGVDGAAGLSSSLKSGEFPEGTAELDCTDFQPGDEGVQDELLDWERRASSFVSSLWPEAHQPLVEVPAVNNAAGEAGRCRTWTATIKRTFEPGESDTVKLIYLNVSGLAGYLRLYFRDAVAPHAICLPWGNGAHQHPWGPFGRVLQIDHAAHESLLLLPRALALDSPYVEDWHFKSREFLGWDRVAYSTKAPRLCHLL